VSIFAQDPVGAFLGQVALRENPSPADGVPSLIFTKAVVCEVMYDPSALSPARRLSYRDRTSNEEIFDAAPRNSLLVQITEGAAARLTSDMMCVYPMFPPHLMLPIKAGEIVWIFDPDPNNINDIAYWVCRVHAPNFVDDINYTHLDRQMMESNVKMEPPYPKFHEFPNGGNTQSSMPVSPVERYDQIFTGSLASRATTFESVPRFTPRPGDLTLQGSNNTLICLGQSRGYSAADEASAPQIDKFKGVPYAGSDENSLASNKAMFYIPEVANLSNATPGTPGSILRQGQLPTELNSTITDEGASPPSKWQLEDALSTGAIDIVAGRGQEVGTSAGKSSNFRGYDETEKNPINFAPLNPQQSGPSNISANPREGDPDFEYDLSRINISMKLDGDQRFGLAYPEGDWAGSALEAGFKPFVVTKSDEVRIIGRKSGSVRIVKEGTPGDSQCVITLLSDGTLGIDAKKILIGDGRDDQIYLGDPQKSATEPLVLGKALHDMLLEFCSTAGVSVDSHGSPVQPLNKACSTLKSKLPKFLSKVGYISDKGG